MEIPIEIDKYQDSEELWTIQTGIDLEDSFDIFDNPKAAANNLRLGLHRFKVQYKFDQDVPTEIKIRTFLMESGLDPNIFLEKLTEVPRAAQFIRYFLKSQSDSLEVLK